MRSRCGFTLIELLIVLAIIGILVGVVSLAVGNIAADADAVADSAQQQIVQTAIDTYIAMDRIDGAPEIGARILPDVVGPDSMDAPFGKYLRRNTKYYYTWDVGGDALHETTFEVHGAHFVDGLVNKAFDFPQLELSEGSRLYPYVHQEDRDSLDLTSAGTISAWIKPHSFVQGSGIAHKGESAEIDGIVFADEAYTLQFHWNSSQRDRLLLGLVDENGGYEYIVSDPLPLTDTWYHVLGAWDSSGMRLYAHYRDGSGSEHVIAEQNSEAVVARDSDGALIIGAQLTAPFNGSVFNWGFDGVIDEVSVHNRAWSAAEVQDYYDATKGD